MRLLVRSGTDRFVVVGGCFGRMAALGIEECLSVPSLALATWMFSLKTYQGHALFSEEPGGPGERGVEGIRLPAFPLRQTLIWLVSLPRGRSFGG